MKENYQTALAMIMGVLLVTSAVPAVTGSPPVGQATAQDGSSDGAAVTLDCGTSNIFGFALPACDLHTQTVIYEGRTAEEVHTDIYSNAAGINDTITRQTTEATSHSNQTFGIGLAEAKYTIIQELNNGSSLEEAKAAATSEVNEWYSSQQKGLWATQAAAAKQAQSLNTTLSNTSGLGWGIMTNNNGNVNYTTVEKELWNGETINVTTAHRSYRVYIDGPGDYTQTERYTYYDGSTTPESGGGDHNHLTTMAVNSPWNDTNTETVMAGGEFKQSYETLAANRQSTLQQSIQVAEDIYGSYNPGDLDISDVQSPEELVRNSVSDYGSTGDMAYPILVAEEMGYATDADTNFQISLGDGTTVQTSGGTVLSSTSSTSETLSGALLWAPTSNASNITIEAGGTYNTSEVGEFIIYETTNTGVEKHTLDNETFSVNKMVDTSTGEEVNQTTLQASGFATTDADHVQEQINKTETHRTTINKTIVHEGGSGINIPDFDGLPGFWNGAPVGIIVFAGGAVLIIFAAISGGGRR